MSEQKKSQTKQLYIAGGVLGFVLLFVGIGFYSMFSDNVNPVQEESVVKVPPSGRLEDNTGGDLANLPPKYRDSIDAYNKAQAEKINDENVLAAMPMFTPENIDIRPDSDLENIEAKRAEQARQASERVRYERPTKERKTYEIDEYQSKFLAVEEMLLSFREEDKRLSSAEGKAVVIDPAAIEKFSQMNSPSQSAVRVVGDPRSAVSPQEMAQQRYPVSAGDIFYGYYINQVDTASGSEVVFKVTSGPLKNSRFIGTPILVNKKAVIRYTQALTEDGQKLDIKAAAVTMGEVSSLVDGNYDGAYWARMGLPGLAAIISGTTSATAEILRNEGTTISVLGIDGAPVQSRPREDVSSALKKGIFQGVGSAGGVIAGELQKEAAMNKPNVTIPANTTAAVLMFSGVAVPQGQTFKTSPALSDEANLGLIPAAGQVRLTQ